MIHSSNTSKELTDLPSGKGPDTVFTDLGQHYKSRFPFKVQKIALNVGFTCPNRDGTKGRGGCTYCNNESFSPGYVEKEESIEDQIQRGIAFHSRKKEAGKYVAYFQSYTNTYSSVEGLKDLYERALKFNDVIGITIGTRPDCIDAEIIGLLREIASRKMVTVEFGVESTLERTLETINRKHTFDDSRSAIELCSMNGLEVGAHLILGLPGESRQELIDHARKISDLPISYLKIHHLQIVEKTVMAAQYRKDPQAFDLFSAEEYLRTVSLFIANLRPGIVIERVISTAPPTMLVAPKWGGVRNADFMTRVRNYMFENKLYQGKYYEGESA